MAIENPREKFHAQFSHFQEFSNNLFINFSVSEKVKELMEADDLDEIKRTDLKLDIK